MYDKTRRNYQLGNEYTTAQKRKANENNNNDEQTNPFSLHPKGKAEK